MVKSAASNPGQPASSSAQTAPQAVPTNMASGTANNPLAGLTGARYAGQGLNMPGLDMFGPDGGVRISLPAHSCSTDDADLSTDGPTHGRRGFDPHDG